MRKYKFKPIHLVIALVVLFLFKSTGFQILPQATIDFPDGTTYNVPEYTYNIPLDNFQTEKIYVSGAFQDLT